MKWLRDPKFYADGFPAVGLLFLRMFIGYAMVMHGLPKMSHPFSWMDQGPQPSGVFPLLQGLGAAGEFFGGLGLLFGAFTPIAALGVISTMFVAILSTVTSGPGPNYFIKPPGAEGNSYESAATYFIFALTLFLTGPGLLSIDAFLFGRRDKAVVPPVSAPAGSPPAVAKTS